VPEYDLKDKIKNVITFYIILDIMYWRRFYMLQIQICWDVKLCVGVIDPEASHIFFFHGQINPEKGSITILNNRAQCPQKAIILIFYVN